MSAYGCGQCRFSKHTNCSPLFLAFLLSPALASSQDCALSGADLAVNTPIAIIQTANAATVLHVKNQQTSDLSFNLTAGPFVSQTTHGIVSGAKAEFSIADGNPAMPKTLPAGGIVEILATISNESAIGVSVARVFNSGKCVGELKAVRYDAPLNFAVEGDGSANSAIRVQDKEEIEITLRNNDDLTYPITPALYFEGQEVSLDPLIIGPNSSTSLRFHPAQKWFDVGTLFRTRPATLRLLVRLTPSVFGDMASNRSLPSRAISVNAQLARFAPVPSQFISSGVVFVVLLVGGLASLAINSLLPNVLKKLSYKKKLQLLADGTSAVSVKVDSRLRVLLRLERNRLLKLLASSNLFATNASDVFQQIDVGISALSKRLTVAQRLDELRNRFDLHSASCPPSVSDKIDQNLQDAADLLRSMYLTDKNIEAAKLALDAAEQTLDTLDQTDVLAKDIGARHAQLLSRVHTFSDADLAALKDALPGIFKVLTQTYDDAHPVLPSNFMEVDDSIARVNVALDSAYVSATTKDETIQDRLKSRRNKLIQLLGTRDWRSLRSARDLVQQMRENIYPEDLTEDVRAQKAGITIDQ